MSECLRYAYFTKLESMAQTYDVQTTLAMERLAAPFQREHLWTHFQDTIADIVKTRKRLGESSAHPEK